jgi:predicted ester cyclase
MNKVDIVKTAFNFDDPEQSAALLADDFTATDSVGSPPMDKAGWAGMGEMMRASFPDIDYVIEDIREEGAGVKVTGYFTGTFTNDLDMTPLGMGVVPASGAKVRWPSSTSQVSIEGGKITNSHGTDTGPDAGMAGFLKVIGADMG